MRFKKLIEDVHYYNTPEGSRNKQKHEELTKKIKQMEDEIEKMKEEKRKLFKTNSDNIKKN